VGSGAHVPGGRHDGSLGHRFAVAYGLTLLEDDA
jgi:hypothetical protein